MQMYIYFYDIDKNKFHSCKADAEEKFGAYILKNTDDESVCVLKDEIDNPRFENFNGEHIILMYSLSKEPDSACECMYEFINEQYTVTQALANELFNISGHLVEKKAYIESTLGPIEYR